MSDQETETRSVSWGALPALSGLVLLFLALSIQKIWNVDLWWQLRTGQWILERGAVPFEDVFSFTAAGREWIELRWLFCVAAYAGWKIGGATLLILGQTAALAATFAILAWPSRRVITEPVAMALLALGIFAASDRFVVRPELVSFLLIAVFLVVLEGFVRRRYRRAIWVLPLLQVVWVNAHTLFVFGPVLTWSFAAGAIVKSRRDEDSGDEPTRGRVLTLAGAVTAACFVNPYLHRGALFPFTLLGEIRGESALASLIQEFVGPFSMTFWPWYLWAAAILTGLSALTFLLALRDFDWARLLLWLLFLYVATLAVRNVALFALVATWAGLRNYETFARERTFPRWAHSALPFAHLGLAAIFLLGAWYVVTDRYAVSMGSPRQFGMGVVDSNTPRQAAAFLEESGVAPQIYNDLADGSYFIWALGDRYPVFVDGRLEVYGEDLLGRFLAVPLKEWQSDTEWNAFATPAGIKTVVLNREYHRSLLTRLQRSAGWVLVHLDARNLVFVRRVPENEEVIARHRIDPSRSWRPRGAEDDVLPTGWRRWIGAVGRLTHSFEMAKSLLAVQSPANAAIYLEKGLAGFPDHREMRWTLAQTYRFLGRATDADLLMAGFELSPEETVRAERFLGHLYWAQGRLGKAAAPFERALALEPDNRAILTDLAKITLAAKDYRGAVDAFRRALDLHPDDPPSWVSLGLASERLGDRAGAIAAYRRAVLYDPSLYQVHNQLGMLLAQQGELLEASFCFERALRIRPDYAAARANLERLRSSR
jgi:tetratricopeptide (TPR) repeat protein